MNMEIGGGAVIVLPLMRCIEFRDVNQFSVSCLRKRCLSDVLEPRSGSNNRMGILKHVCLEAVRNPVLKVGTP
jgi:hypothetical protein